MEDLELENFELFILELRKANFNYEVKELEDKYMFTMNHIYGDTFTHWGIFVKKEDGKNHFFVNLSKIPVFKKIDFLEYINSLNQDFYNMKFSLLYDEEENNYQIILNRCYETNYLDFDPAYYVSMIIETHRFLEYIIIPELIKFKSM